MDRTPPPSSMAIHYIQHFQDSYPWVNCHRDPMVSNTTKYLLSRITDTNSELLWLMKKKYTTILMLFTIMSGSISVVQVFFFWSILENRALFWSNIIRYRSPQVLQVLQHYKYHWQLVQVLYCYPDWYVSTFVFNHPPYQALHKENYAIYINFLRTMMGQNCNDISGTMCSVYKNNFYFAWYFTQSNGWSISLRFLFTIIIIQIRTSLGVFFL